MIIKDVKYLNHRNLLKSMKFLLNMSKFIKMKNKMCMEVVAFPLTGQLKLVFKKKKVCLSVSLSVPHYTYRQ
jgi:hypothetical protein